jgi:hypothetical protein
MQRNLDLLKQLHRFQARLAQAEQDARLTLQAAGFDVEKLEATDIAQTSDIEYSRLPRTYSVDSNVSGAEKLSDPTDPAHYAFVMLRWVRLAREAIDDSHASSAELLRMIRCFDLGVQYRRAELGMMFPKIEDSFRVRRQKELARKPRSDALQQIIIEILHKDLTLTARQVLHRLEGYTGMGVIESVSEDNIEWIGKNGHIKDTPVTGLDDRIRRARDFLKRPIDAE